MSIFTFKTKKGDVELLINEGTKLYDLFESNKDLKKIVTKYIEAVEKKADNLQQRKTAYNAPFQLYSKSLKGKPSKPSKAKKSKKAKKVKKSKESSIPQRVPKGNKLSEITNVDWKKFLDQARKNLSDNVETYIEILRLSGRKPEIVADDFDTKRNVVDSHDLWKSNTGLRDFEGIDDNSSSSRNSVLELLALYKHYQTLPSRKKGTYKIPLKDWKTRTASSLLTTLLSQCKKHSGFKRTFINFISKQSGISGAKTQKIHKIRKPRKPQRREEAEGKVETVGGKRKRKVSFLNPLLSSAIKDVSTTAILDPESEPEPFLDRPIQESEEEEEEEGREGPFTFF